MAHEPRQRDARGRFIKGNKEGKRFNKNNATNNGSKGGINSGEARAERKTLREMLSYFTQVPLKKGEAVQLEDIHALTEAGGENLTAGQAMVLALMQAALKGDVKAFEVIRDTLGERPDNKLNIAGTVPVTIVDDLGDDDDEE